jgi:FkbM family methyltransferase
MIKRHPIKKHCFEQIRRLGIPISTIVDVGIQTGTPELMESFPDKPHLLFEPIEEWHPQIRATYTKKGINHHLFGVAASDKDGQINLRTASIREGQPVTHARITTDTAGANLRSVVTRRLDTLLPELSETGPFLLKLDVDGAELDILKGAAGILPNCPIIVIETNITNFAPRVAAVTAAGFTLFDIVDLVYYDDRLRVADLVFSNDATINSCGLDMYKQVFDLAKYKPYTP